MITVQILHFMKDLHSDSRKTRSSIKKRFAAQPVRYLSRIINLFGSHIRYI